MKWWIADTKVDNNFRSCWRKPEFHVKEIVALQRIPYGKRTLNEEPAKLNRDVALRAV
jgi:hypothetical protein